jgi:ABC-2 type transport system permease protein
MNDQRRTGRLSTLAAAFVVARRDFTAILMSRSFIFFLLGPLFLFTVGSLAGGIGRQAQDNARPVLGVAMSAPDVERVMAARERLEKEVPGALPDTVVIKRLAPGEQFDAGAEMLRNHANLAALLTGTPEQPSLTGSLDRIDAWKGRVALLNAEAAGKAPSVYPAVALAPIASSTADRNSDRAGTAQLAQGLMFVLMMLLAGMVLSNLVEEKGNKIIEILAAAVPMDAVFMGKLFAMLAVSLVGITVWGVALGLFGVTMGQPLPPMTAPAVGWPAFVGLGVIYFALGYLILGSLFLTIGSLAATVRDVQTLSMPVTMLQLLTFFFASYAISRPGSWVELAAITVPFSSPFAMLARAAQDDRLWIHAAAIAWQVLCVAAFVRAGSMLFRRWVMKSGQARGERKSRWRRSKSTAAA